MLGGPCAKHTDASVCYFLSTSKDKTISYFLDSVGVSGHTEAVISHTKNDTPQFYFLFKRCMVLCVCGVMCDVCVCGVCMYVRSVCACVYVMCVCICGVCGVCLCSMCVWCMICVRVCDVCGVSVKYVCGM